MRGTVTIGGVGIALRAPEALEEIVLQHFSSYCGAIGAPACWIDLEAMPTPGGHHSEAVEVKMEANGTVSVSHQWFRGSFDPEARGRLELVAHRAALDYCSQLLWATLALHRGGMLVAAAAAISHGRAHIFVGDTQAMVRALVEGPWPLLSSSRVAVYREGNRWLAASTPFDAYDAPASPRVAPLQAIWIVKPGNDTEVVSLGIRETIAVVLEHALVFSGDPQLRRTLFDSAVELAEQVPAGLLGTATKTTCARLNEMASALGVQRALLAWEQPELRSRILSHTLPAPRAGRGRKRSPRLTGRAARSTADE